ncbi:hypothetical protein [Terasakiella sp. SH-1]|uniref:hypothetical protein n=1 Tax=Terasakiella sp. SH-1 TaxID=2560057 RepID=UPI001073D98E|nr:hypothetical protein [Terasakiella sp. SH-1]
MLKIHVINTKTVGGLDAKINALDPSSTGDKIIGEINTPAGWRYAQWDEAGTCRDATDSANLDKTDPKLADVFIMI